MERMESITNAQPDVSNVKQHLSFNESGFRPKGAVAFFIALVLLSLIFWFGIYFLMLSRA